MCLPLDLELQSHSYWDKKAISLRFHFLLSVPPLVTVNEYFLSCYICLFNFFLKKLFRGPILYLAAQDQTFSTNTPGTLSNQEMWKACLGGKVYVLECPGNHYSIITEPINAKNIGHSIVAAATLSLKNMRPYKIRDQLTNFKKSKLLMLKQHGLSVGVFEWKEGKTVVCCGFFLHALTVSGLPPALFRGNKFSFSVLIFCCLRPNS